MGNKIAKFKKIPFINTFSYALDLIHPDLAVGVYRMFKPLLPKWTNFRDKFLKLKNVLKAKTIQEHYDISNKIFIRDDLKALGLNDFGFSQIFKIDFVDNNPIKYMMFYDLKTYLPDDILVKVDKTTMSVALEGREPFLDHKIIEFTSRIPVNLKYKKGISKYILRKLLYKYVPQKLIDRPKMGFGVPIYEWFKRELKNLYLEYLSADEIKKDGYFNHQEVCRLLKNYLEDRGVNHNKLWFLFVFQLWRKRWI